MAKQRNKAYHLQAAASATKVVNDARRRQAAQVAMAVAAGATWSEVAEATGHNSRQAARQAFIGFRTDGEHVWREPTLV